jgi:DNA (cytosine-5)-methyltransferase 1
MSNITYGSVCSGIEAATVAWHELGWTPAWFSEIDPFPCKVLHHHYPAVLNLGDMTKLEQNPHFNESAIDLLVGGTPCQSFSLAGLRAGLASDNGNLALQFCRILRAKRPRWFIWENVPGVFSSYSSDAGDPDLPGEGREHGRTVTETADFAAILAGFSECGYSVAWRVLDSQFFGVPQRRRRVFVVGYFGEDWRPPAAVLFEQESMRGSAPPSREEGQAIAGALVASSARSRGAGTNPGQLTTGLNISFNDVNGQRKDRPKGGLYINETDVANCVTAKGGGGTDTMAVSHSLTTSSTKFRPEDTYVIMSSSQSNAQVLEDGTAPTLTRLNETPVVSGKWPADLASTLNTHYGDKQGLEDQHINSGAPLFVPLEIRPEDVVIKTMIRRLTPVECERLQGFPDDYTKIKGASDSARYKALGNSMTTNVMKWIGRRIKLVEQIKEGTL